VKSSKSREEGQKRRNKLHTGYRGLAGGAACQQWSMACRQDGNSLLPRRDG